MSEEQIKGWLTEEYDYERPKRGQAFAGVILDVSEFSVTVDVGLKRDGIVPEGDLDRLGEDLVSELEPGQEIETRVLRPEDKNGNLVLSIYQARLDKDWNKAQELLESGEIWRGEVIDYNRGGLIVGFNRLRGFVPGSHLAKWQGKRRSSDERKDIFKEYVGDELALKVMEVNQNRRRLILSERLARRQAREENKERLLEELVEGQVCEGIVRHLTDFGAFVDLGGADGLIHISELAWQHVRHPREVVEPGDEIEVYILRLDHKRKRIGLSLKRLQPNPWDQVDSKYAEGQLVLGTVTSLTDFGAFVSLEAGIEGLVHISELSDPPPEDPRTVVQPGDELVLRILRIDLVRHRIGLSLTQVSDEAREKWLEEHQESEIEEPEVASEEEKVASEEEKNIEEEDQSVQDFAPANGKVTSNEMSVSDEETPATKDEAEAVESELEAVVV